MTEPVSLLVAIAAADILELEPAGVKSAFLYATLCTINKIN